jgi:hypothetical protein
MKAVINIHPPDLTPEERAYRMEQLKKATIEYCKIAFKEKSNEKKG